MLFKCEVVSEEIKNSNQITLDINVRDDKSNTSKNFEILIKSARVKSIFHGYYKIGMVINAISYAIIMFLIIKIMQKKDNNTFNLIKQIKQTYNMVFILGFIIFFNSITLFNNILYLEYISEIFINILFIVFIAYILFLMISFFVWINISNSSSCQNNENCQNDDKKQRDAQDNLYISLILQIMSVSTCSVIFLSMNLSIFMNAIHPTILMILFILVSILITVFLGYKFNKFNK